MSLGNSNLHIIIKLHYKNYPEILQYFLYHLYSYFLKLVFSKYVNYKCTFNTLILSTILESTNNNRNIEHFPAVGIGWELLKQIYLYSQLVHLSSMLDIWTMHSLDMKMYCHLRV